MHAERNIHDPVNDGRGGKQDALLGLHCFKYLLFTHLLNSH